MALEFLGNFVGRTLDSLRRFREPALRAIEPVFDAAEIDAWEKFKAEMALEDLERWKKMNLAEAKVVHGACMTCGGRTYNGNCGTCFDWNG